MATLWFCIVAVMLAAYVVLDGFDIGAGIIHLVAARTDNDRRKILRSIGPVWDGNEVWLLAAGGALYFAFPQLYASSFSGFYLPLMIVLWLLMLRAIGLEFRSHLTETVWKQFLDGVFAISSILLAIFYGAALGNVVRGVPLGADHYFFLPLFTNWRVGPNPGILDWYTILIGVAAYLALAMHGALWVAYKCEAEVAARARRIAMLGFWAVIVVTLLITVISLRVQPQILLNLTAHPWGFVFPAIVIASLAGIFYYLRGASTPANAHRAFLHSCGYLFGMLTSVAFGLYPYVLPARAGPGALALDLQLPHFRSGTPHRFGLVDRGNDSRRRLFYFSLSPLLRSRSPRRNPHLRLALFPFALDNASSTMGKLDGKFALITGGNSGIGLASAHLFVDEGAKVAITGRNEETLRHAADSLGPCAFAIRADVTDASDRDRMFSEVKHRFGALDILFANAGLSAPTPLGRTDVATFEKQVQLNFISVFFTVQGALPLLRDGAAIVLISSLTSKLGMPGTSAYAGSKAAVRTMAKAMAAELSPRGIRVNVVTPGYTRTPLWERTRTPQQIAAVNERLPLIVPLERWAEPEEIARAVLFLASSDSSYIQGEEIVIDGGTSNLPGGTRAFRG